MTIDDIKEKLNIIKKSLDIIQAIFPIDKLKQEKADLEEQQNAPDFFSDMKKVQQVGKQIASIDRKITQISKLVNDYQSIEFLANECKDDEQSIIYELELAINNLEKDTASARIEALLNGKYDNCNVLLTIQAGAGGTEAQDWAEMLLRMYQRYVALRGYQAEILDITEGDGAGIKGVTLKIEGENAYGYLKAEKGVHRLVRISPFDSNARRQTSFASVEVIPEIKNDNEIEIKPEDLKIDTFHSGGCGGQGVNTTDSAVRVKHIPTGIVVQCQNERSQIQNKETAINVLKSKLAQLQEEQQQKDLNKIQGDLKKIEWGSQIRSYVFHPYNMVKDHRTDYETSDTTGVMNGKIQPFIEEYLKKSAT